MRILEYGNINNPTIIFIHGFESPYQIWNDYIEHYKDKYHILIPILPGHDVLEKSEFTSFDDIAKELENYCISKSINHVYAVYGMSMGGILASYLWKNNRLTFQKVIFESSPLLSFNKFMIHILTKQYLSITKKARERNKKVIQKAINSMVTEDKLDIFLELLDHISDETIKNYLNAVGQFQLPSDIDTPHTQIIYFYGGKINEFIFKEVARYMKKHYTNAITICLKEKGHCEDALLHPKEWMKQLDKYIEL